MKNITEFPKRTLSVFCINLSVIFNFQFFISYAQEIPGIRHKVIVVSRDTTVMDTLSIIPSTVTIKTTMYKNADTACYAVDFVNALLIKKRCNPGRQDTLLLSYRVFPYLFTKSFRHKDIGLIAYEKRAETNPFVYSGNEKSADEIFNTRGMTKNGSISRGISFGNNQDVAVNSNMNLELSGKVNENVEILAAITDNNIPFQPEGNTQQIQEFDKVFIQLSDRKSTLVAGDFLLKKPPSYFMNFNKKAQGISITTTAHPEKSKDIIYATASAAVSKGKYARNISANGQFNNIMQEGNQGPYKLRGAESESYIIILSGSEKVFIDGKLLLRGQEYDYIMDYNSAEITFTPNQVITKDRRIAVEFEYSEKNYARSMLFAGTGLDYGDVSFRMHIFSEQDSKNQPIQQELDDEKKQILREAGDDLDAAVAPGIDSVAFTSGLVLYKKTDSLVNYPAQSKSYIFKNVYVYSIHPDSAHFQLGFSLVGQGKGNYRQITSSVNGKVFRWVAPALNADGTFIPQGTYEPVVKLITPKQKQMVAFSAGYRINGSTTLSYEGALSNNDLNTFSPLNSDDDAGFANRFALKKSEKIYLNRKQSALLESGIFYENKGKTFTPLERYRPVEFERDWNLPLNQKPLQEHTLGGEIGLLSVSGNKIKYHLQSLYQGADYRGIKNALSGAVNSKFLFAGTDVSFLNSSGNGGNTQFLRTKTSFGSRWKNLMAGVRQENENNVIKKNSSDTMRGGSFSWFQWEPFVATSDTSANTFSASYKERTDRLPAGSRFAGASKAGEVNASAMFAKNPKNRFKAQFTYRNLAILDTLLTAVKPENTILGRVEYYLQLFKGAAGFGTYYELGTGQEYKKEFYYIKVPPGQGIYAWKDYNGNGQEDLNEFEIAAFSDEAQYLRIYTPTNEIQKTHLNLFNQTFELRPANIWGRKKGVKRFLTRFSDQAAYRLDKKTVLNNLLKAYNPFVTAIADTELLTINYSFRNTLYFNRTSPVFGIDLNYQSNRGKALLTNGFDSRAGETRGGKIRGGVSRAVTVYLIGNNGYKSVFSEYFSSRKFHLSFFETEPQLVFQQNTGMRIKVSYKYSEKRNAMFPDGTGGEAGYLNNAGIEIKRSAANKGFLQAQANYIEINFRYPETTPVAYEILEGLHPGQNITWSLSYQQNLSDHIQMSLSYDGRKSEKTKAVHTGSVQMRAFF